MVRLRQVVELPAVDSERLTDRISIGVLARIVSRDLVDEALVETKRQERRTRLLPARVMVYFTMAMCLFFDDDYEEVMRKLAGALRWLGNWKGDWQVPTSGAISQARIRLGAAPLKLLFERVAVPVAGRGTKGAWLRSRRLTAIDGFFLDAADTPENVARFGRHTNGHKASALPQVHVVALAECGTHAIVAAAVGPRASDERTLAATLFDACEPGMLLTADRNFYGRDLWHQALDTGADLLWRVRSNLALPVIQPLPDGSYLSIVINPKLSGKRREQLIVDARAGRDFPEDYATPVRVIEYTVPDRTGAGTGELICLITNILDHTDISAVELATGYHERWEIERIFDEVKTHQRGEARSVSIGQCTTYESGHRSGLVGTWPTDLEVRCAARC
ncbi:IS4 family transposase [Frankia sp. CgS1]|uniref:IS4 family transposase n=1 Tax=Frankia sp. CgS1 TaxID=1745381 RepID=UPI0032C2340E